MKIKNLPLEKITPYERNPRKNQAVDKVAASIQEFGFRQPIVVDEKFVIIAGHTRYMAAQQLGLTEVPVHVATDLTPEQVKAYRIADNRVAEEAEWDEDLLAIELGEMLGTDYDVALTGLDPEELSSILAAPTFTDSPDDLDNVPNVPKENPITQPGDLYEIGPHRLLCGNCTSFEAVERLMDGEKADMVFTDPPYNLAEKTNLISQPNAKSHKKLKNSEWDKGFKPTEFLNPLLTVLNDAVSVYVCMSHFIAGEIWAWMETWADYNGYVVWNKPNPMPSLMKKCWTWNTELIAYAHRGNYTFNFPKEGHALQGWVINKIAKSDLHPTMKPVDVPLHAISHSSKQGDLVLDLFGGSGSTMVAAQQASRRCFMMEIDPHYCDVIVSRMKTLFPDLPIQHHKALDRELSRVG